MKKNMSGLIIMLMFIIACTTQPVVSSGGKTLDYAIAEAAIKIDTEIQAGTKMALLNFTSPSDRFSLYVLDELTANLMETRKMTIVDRREVDLIRSEFNFQFSGEVGDDSMQELGRMLGAQAIISGSLTEIGADYRIVIRVLNVQTAALAVHYRSDIENDRRVQALLEGGRTTTTSTGGQSNLTSSSGAQATQGTAANIYRIGDVGPAGGIIFYDKGNNSGGWRYLEVAPATVEFQAPWSVRLGNVLNMVRETQSGIGSGRQNTRLIGELLSRTGGEWDSAAIKVVELELNGFSDWFLPSSGELDLMYGNLKRRNLGDFTDGWYWSSTEHRQGPDLGWGVVIQNFSDGQISVAVIGIMRDNRASSLYVRPIRQVAGS